MISGTIILSGFLQYRWKKLSGYTPHQALPVNQQWLDIPAKTSIPGQVLWPEHSAVQGPPRKIWCRMPMDTAFLPEDWVLITASSALVLQLFLFPAATVS